MHKNISRMAYLEVTIFLCSMVTFMVSNCETELENSNRKVKLPRFLSELDLSSIEASIENEESLRKIVKRLAPEKNGEYQIYQVFFGNADLLKEWLKGAGVTGQPGVDFPALTAIPATSFSCRGLKGGYYADLETNCQVFHICDNGRKISFLCPNGTIFQQSQLICDWWFKVDCSKSTELYEQSSEQLHEEERRRAESRNSRLDYQQPIETGGQQDYYDVQNLSYDGRQNGRTKSYEEPPQENQVQPNRERAKSSRHFGSGNSFSRESNAQRDDNQLFDANRFQTNQPSNTKQQFNQFARNTEEGSVNRYSTTNQNHYSTSKKSQNYHPTNRHSNNQPDDKGALKRFKFKGLIRNGTNSTSSQRPTSLYTESTTFRAGDTGSVKETQQFAESGTFVGRSGNRFNVNTDNSHQYYYQLHVNRDSTTRNTSHDSTGAITWNQDKENDFSTQRNDFLPFTDTTSTAYETTTQYATVTATPSCNDEVATESSVLTNPSTNFDTQPTESLMSANSNYEYHGNAKNAVNARNSFTDKNYYNGNNNRDANRLTNVNGNSETLLPTTRSYVTTDTYRQNAATPSSSQQKHTSNYFSPTPTVSFRNNNLGYSTEKSVTRNTIDNQSSKLNNDFKATNKNPSTISPGYRQNFISTTTEKPSRITPVYQQNIVTEKDLSPYDRSFTYKQGKVMSTLGPYVPFTKNYAYSSSTSTVSKPSLYTPTVPTYTIVYTSPKPLTTKLKYPAPTLLSKIKPSAARLSEREHALSMLQSLKNLEDNVPSLSDALKGDDRTSNSSVPPAVSTLHSLALYFSTVTENFDSNETTDSSTSVESAEDIEKPISSKENNATVQVPAGILTQHTINSYAKLFKLNDAGESNNVTTEDRVDDATGYKEDYDDDLELQQSGRSLDDLRKSNNTRFRELAQVFTHALSAYLLDPDAFKKVLTEIRPTEPSQTTEENEQWRTTTTYTIMDETNTSPIKEKDEVLDFSGDNDIREKFTTIYPTTIEPPTTTAEESVYDIFSTLPSTYYATPRTFAQDALEYTTNFASSSPVTSAYFETSLPPTESTFAAEQSSTPYESDSSKFYNQNNEISKENVEPTATNNYTPSDEVGGQTRVGGFQNNSVTTTTEPYRIEKLLATTPISDNYIVSPTPSSPEIFIHMATYNWNKKSTSKRPEQQLTPPYFESYAEGVRKDNGKISVSLIPEGYSSTPISTHSTRTTTFGLTKGYETSTFQPHKSSQQKSLLHEPKQSGISPLTSWNTYTKLKNLYDNIDVTERPTATTSKVTELITTTTNNIDTTPCTSADSDDSSEITSRKEESKMLDDHWTSSPAVTHLWETSVFVDPQRINHDLESDPGPTASTGTFSVTDSQEYGNTRSFSEEMPGSSEESFVDDEDLSSSSQRLSRDKDSPTTFSLLPTSFTAENTVTPKPLITTTASTITSTNSLPQESLVTTLLPFTVTTSKLNGTENEIAEKLFGKLNASSTNTLMNVMKQADNNETVRQLVLLLIRHCSDLTNKTMQREKEELLNALLRLPVSEFSSEESKNALAGINQLSLPAVRPANYATSASTTPLITEPPVTTFRSRKYRKFRTTTESSANIVRRSEKGITLDGNNSLQEDGTSASDNRALELLRSLYTIATKWG
ncbi:chitin-binding domain protein thawb [Xylocopa sonorina]|uniref:chitin-binding domain protein thawb n=1 Tax=Xylocopa sonorina TaxID=1818115 RepID=UPI00403AD108